jgi:hypothetical protein
VCKRSMTLLFDVWMAYERNIGFETDETGLVWRGSVTIAVQL